MANPQVIILDNIDIFDLGYVDSIINVQEEKTFSRDKLINNEISISVKNFDNFFSVNKNTSIFNGIRWRYSSIKMYNPDGDLIWDGIIKNIYRDHNTGMATISSINALHKSWNRLISYSSSGDETPATAAKNIMDNYDISYDERTVNASINKLDAESCYVRVNITQDDNVTVMGALEKLSEYACADCYSHNNKVYFKHWEPFVGGVKVSLTEESLKTRPIVTDTETEIINNYSISYDGDNGTPITDATGNNIGSVSRLSSYYGTHDLPGFDSGGYESQIYFVDQTSAQYIGECYIKRTHINLSTQPRPPIKIDFELKGTNEDWIDLETYFRLTFDDEGWSNKLFEFFRTDINYKENFISLTALETQE